ncbi:caprin-1 [Aplysia californica]|uniref:Caprin-1 n=1 Tax=Aplysia californica TaxID=6500 RepID=A0ABM1A273_APLCA|nr:caprin-1 [Aplysia californica]
MKMPATTNIKVEAKPSAEIGDAAKQCLNCLEKKVRNLEKRKGRIEQNQEKASKGSKLEKEQEISLHQYEQVTHDLEFAKELHKQFLCIHQEHEKMVKKQAKREKAERQAVEIKRVSEILQLQCTLDLMGGMKVREDFKTGKHGAVVLTDDNLDQLDKLYQAISPSRDDSGDDYPQRLTAAAEHMVNILDGKDRQVLGTTYKELKELLTLINECGYFEKANPAVPEEVIAESTEEVEEEEAAVEVEETSGETGAASPCEAAESVPEPQQQPIDLTVGPTDGAQSQMEMPQQPMNTMEQDAFFAPSSTTAYQEDSEARYSPVYRTAQQAPDFESFTNNRPFQFIQTSYVMSESQATAPSVVDPAVIHAQPAAGSGLAFMSQSGFEPAAPPQAASTQPQPLPQQPPTQAMPSPAVNILAMTAELSQGESLSQQPQQQQTTPQPPQPQPQPQQQSQPEYSSQGFSQVPQPMQPEGLFNAPAGVVEEVPNPLAPHPGIMGQRRGEDSSASPYEIPPSIPMPPSQSQGQSQIEQQQQQQEKKFQMNASAPVFQSMYAQVPGGQTAAVSVPPPVVPVVSSDGQTVPPTGDYNNAAVPSGADYQQGYQGNNGFNNGYPRGGRGGFRGSRGGGAPSGNNRNGGPGPMQNGFGNRGGGPGQNNSRGGRGGTFQGYPPNANYRPDSFQGNYNAGGFGKFQKRGGMNNAGGPGNAGYPRGGPGGNGGRGGGMHGMPRGGSGGPRGGGPRGGFNRPPPNQ